MGTLKYIIEVPDRVFQTISSSRGSREEELDTTEELVAKALTLNEYNENVYFMEGEIKVTKRPENL
jgi:vacuolar-type H+-ATPase subunit D/Vma8